MPTENYIVVPFTAHILPIDAPVLLELDVLLKPNLHLDFNVIILMSINGN